MSENQEEKIERLEKENASYKTHGAIGYYYELNRWVNSTVNIMRNSSASSLLVPSKDEDSKKFEKMMALIKNTKEWIDNMEELKIKLNLTGDEEKDKRRPFITTVAQIRN